MKIKSLSPKPINSVTQLCPTLCNPMHSSPPCSSPTPGTTSNSCPLCRGCYPTISPSVVPFSSCFQSFQASESFPMSQFFTSGDQSIEASVSALVLPVNIQGWTCVHCRKNAACFSACLQHCLLPTEVTETFCWADNCLVMAL